MISSPRFNYIITIHNKEDMIEQVIMSVLMCCRDNSHIYPVIDGCTDKTEEIIDRITNTFSGVPITKIHTADVHELLSINAGLRAANQDGDCYNIILQDDVILADFMLENKVVALYEWAGPQLGYISFRLGANFSPDAASSSASVPFCDYVENAYGHGLKDANVLIPGHFAYRSIPIKSPVCIPSALIRTVGIFDERLAPYGHDDTEFALRLIKAGYRNGVFAIKFFSDVKWGGTRNTPHPELNSIVKRNMNLIRDWHGSDIADICKLPNNDSIIPVPGMSDDNNVKAEIDVWNRNREELARFQKTNMSSLLRTVVNKVFSISK